MTRMHLISVIIGLVTSLTVIGSATADTQGVSDNEVVIGTHVDLSGPITFWGVPVRNGMIMATEEINAAGGIHGRSIKLVVEDSGYDPKKAVLATQKLLTRDKIFIMAGAMGTPTVLASMPMVLKRGLPHVFPLTAAEQMYEPFHKLKFSMAAPYHAGMRTGIQWLVENNNRGVVCSLHQDDEFGLNVHRGVVEQTAAMGLPLAEVTTYKRGATDFSSQVARMKAADCDLVALGTIIRETIGAMAEARKMGWAPDFLVSSAGYAPEVAMLGKGVTDGLYGLGQNVIPYYETATPEVRDWMDRHEARFNAPASIQAVYGYIVIQATAEGLKNAGRDLNPESFVAGLEQIKEWTSIFEATPMTFSAERHLGASEFYLSQIQNGKWVKLAGPMTF